MNLVYSMHPDRLRALVGSRLGGVFARPGRDGAEPQPRGVIEDEGIGREVAPAGPRADEERTGIHGATGARTGAR